MWVQGRHWEGLGAVLGGTQDSGCPSEALHLWVCVAVPWHCCSGGVSVPRGTGSDCLPRECVHTMCVLCLIASPSRFESNFAIFFIVNQ